MIASWARSFESRGRVSKRWPMPEPQRRRSSPSWLRCRIRWPRFAGRWLPSWDSGTKRKSCAAWPKLRPSGPRSQNACRSSGKGSSLYRRRAASSSPRLKSVTISREERTGKTRSARSSSQSATRYERAGGATGRMSMRSAGCCESGRQTSRNRSRRSKRPDRKGCARRASARWAPNSTGC